MSASCPHAEGARSCRRGGVYGSLELEGRRRNGGWNRLALMSSLAAAVTAIVLLTAAAGRSLPSGSSRPQVEDAIQRLLTSKSGLKAFGTQQLAEVTANRLTVAEIEVTTALLHQNPQHSTTALA